MTFNPMEHLMKLSNKDYLQVQWRLVWFRDAFPHGIITTSMLQLDLEHGLAVFKAIVDDGEGGIGTGHGSETFKDFRDFIEKAETKAIGRALAALGYGTQFAPELDEGDRIVDTPVQRKSTEKPATSPVTRLASNFPASSTQTPSESSLEVEKLLAEVKQSLYVHYQFKPEDQEPKWKTFKVHVLGMPVEDEGLSLPELKRLRDAVKMKIANAKGAA